MRISSCKEFIGGLLALFLIVSFDADASGRLVRYTLPTGNTWGPVCLEQNVYNITRGCELIGATKSGAKSCNHPTIGNIWVTQISTSCDVTGNTPDDSWCEQVPDFEGCPQPPFDKDSEYCTANPDDSVCTGDFPDTESPPTNEQCSNGLGHPQCCDAYATNSCAASGTSPINIAYDSILGNPRCSFACGEDDTPPDNGNIPDDGGGSDGGNNGGGSDGGDNGSGGSGDNGSGDNGSGDNGSGGSDGGTGTTPYTPPQQPDVVNNVTNNNQTVNTFQGQIGTRVNDKEGFVFQTTGVQNKGVMTESDQELNKKLEHLETRMRTTNSQLVNLNDLANDHSEFLSQIGESQVSGFNNVVGEINESSDAITSRLDRNNSTLLSIDKNVHDGLAKSNSLSEDANGLLGDIKNNTDGLGSKLDGIKDAIDGIGGVGTVDGGASPTGGLTGFYTPLYPDGLQGVWDSKRAQLTGTPLFGFVNQFGSVALTNQKNWDSNWCFNISGMANFGCHSLSIPPYVLAFIKTIFLVSCAFLSYHIVTRGSK